MQKYQNNVINQSGYPVIGATVTVTLYPAGTPATLYSNDGVTQLPNNTVQTDTSGMFYFYAANGKYQLNISGPGVTNLTLTDIILMDLSELPTSLPATSGQIWNNDGEIAIS